MRWLIIIVAVAVAAYFGYRYYATDSGQQVAEQVEQAATEATEQVEAAATEATEQVEQAATEATEEVEQAAEAVTDEAREATDQATDTAQQAAQSVSDLTVNGVDLGQEIGTTISDATSALEGITDKASAEAAQPSLEAVQAKVDELAGSVSELPQAAQEGLASLLADGLPTLQALVTKVEAIDGVGPVVKPTLDAIMTKLDAWAKQPA
jgi:predicted phage tail protein